jgi:hypothetical protein
MERDLTVSTHAFHALSISEGVDVQTFLAAKSGNLSQLPGILRRDASCQSRTTAE